MLSRIGKETFGSIAIDTRHFLLKLLLLLRHLLQVFLRLACQLLI